MKIHVCLVRTENSGNIGSVARAMSNMGADQLILIDPRCRITTKTRQMASGAQAQLKKCIRYKSWEEFYKMESHGIRIALTRRAGKRRRVDDMSKVLKTLKRSKTAQKNLPIYLIFGPEADGLDIGDLAFVNFCCTLPVHGQFGSMNLSHAVMLALFLTRESFPSNDEPLRIKGAEAKAIQPFYFPDESIRQWLVAMGFDINARRSSAYLTLRKLFLQNCPTEHELHVLESVLQQNIRKLKTGASAFFASENLTDNVGKITIENVDTP